MNDQWMYGYLVGSAVGAITVFLITWSHIKWAHSRIDWWANEATKQVQINIKLVEKMNRTPREGDEWKDQ